MIRFGSMAAASILLAAMALNPVEALAQDASHPPTLKLPGMPATPLPPRSKPIPRPGEDEPGLGARAAPQNRSTDSDEKSAATPEPPRTRAQALDDLFARLAASKDADETAGLVRAIDRLELVSGSDAGDLIMARAMAAMGAKNYDVAASLLDKLIDLDPQWAEAWNKRATLRFILEDDKGSMADIAH